MSNSTFYVKDYKGKLVAAKFLYSNGQPVADPNANEAEDTKLYDSKGSLLSSQNENGYLIVPADYSIQNVINFAKTVSDLASYSAIMPDGTPIDGAPAALIFMAGSFIDNGPQDLQRTYDGKSRQPPVPAFIDAASFHLGVVTAYAGIPMGLAEIGGGTYNKAKNFVETLLGEKPSDMSGAYGLSQINTRSIRAGYEFGTKLLNSSSSPPSEATPPPADAKTSSTQNAGRDIYDIAMSAGGDKRYDTGLQQLAQRHGSLSPGGFAPVAMSVSAAPRRPASRIAADSTGKAPFPATHGAAETAHPGGAKKPGSGLGPKYRKILDEAKAQAAEAKAKRSMTAPTPLQGRGLADGAYPVSLPQRLRNIGAGQPARLAVAEDGAASPHGATRSTLDGISNLARSALGIEPAFAGTLPPAAPAPHDAPLQGMSRQSCAPQPAPITQENLAEALDEYFYRQSLLAPTGAPGFNPMLTPPWAGIKLPG